MRVLSIKQPWATLISEGVKLYEFRTWNTKYRGEFLIHASSTDTYALERFNDLGYNYPTGCIIAKVTLNDVIKVDDCNRKSIYNENKLVYKNIVDTNYNGYAFKLSNIKKIHPIYISGKLGFWNYDINLLNEYQKELGNIPEFLFKYLDVPSVKRLKGIGYFCGMDYASKDIYDFGKYVSRFDHSLNVALITWKYTHDKCATIAGLIHDIATPTFAHVIDYMNGDYETQESTEEYTKKIIMGDKKLLKLLKEDDIDCDDIINFKKYSIVDNDRPKLCADRFDGIVLPGLFWTKEVDSNILKKLVNSLTIYKNEYDENELGFDDEESAKLAIKISNGIDKECHSNYDNYMMNLLASIVKLSINTGLIKYDDLYTLTEKKLIDIFKDSNNREILEKLNIFMNVKKDDIEVVNLGKIKIRKINPLVKGSRI